MYHLIVSSVLCWKGLSADFDNFQRTAGQQRCAGLQVVKKIKSMQMFKRPVQKCQQVRTAQSEVLDSSFQLCRPSVMFTSLSV